MVTNKNKKAEDFFVPPGSIQLKTIELKSLFGYTLDIRPIVMEMSIFESISSPFLTGELVIQDVLAITTQFPLVGDETIEITFQTPHKAFVKPVSITMRLFSIQEFRTDTKARTSYYIIKLISFEAFREWTTAIRKSFEDMTISDMSTKVFSGYLQNSEKELEVTETTGNRTLVIPNMSPVETMLFLCREAKNSTYEPANYTFFESVENFFFKPIEQMIEEGKNLPKRDRYYTTEKNLDEKRDESEKPYSFLTMNSFRFLSLFNHKKVIHRGGYDNTVFNINPAMSLFEKAQYAYQSDFDKLQKISNQDNKMVSENSDLLVLKGESHQRFIITNKGENSSVEDNKGEFLHLKIGSVGLLENIVVDVDIPGDTTKRVGEIIELEFPEFSGVDELMGKTNKFISGMYLITSVRHFYNKVNGYATILRCVKNAYEESPDINIDKNKNLLEQLLGQTGIETPTLPDITGDII